MTKAETLDKIQKILEQSPDILNALYEAGIAQNDLQTLADDGVFEAMFLLNIGMTRGIEKVTKSFKDEQTGEDIIYDEFLEAFDDPKKFIYCPDGTDIDQQIETLASMIKDAKTESLSALRFCPQGPLAYMIDDELCHRGDTDAMISMGIRYAFGEEENGIFINRQKARAMFTTALECGKAQAEEYLELLDNSNDYYPEIYTLRVTGPESKIAEIDALLGDIFAKSTDPAGITVKELLKILTGSDAYRGRVRFYNTDSDTLELEIQTDNIEAIMYAIEYVFEGCSVEAAIEME